MALVTAADKMYTVSIFMCEGATQSFTHFFFFFKEIYLQTESWSNKLHELQSILKNLLFSVLKNKRLIY